MDINSLVQALQQIRGGGQPGMPPMAPPAMPGMPQAPQGAPQGYQRPVGLLADASNMAPMPAPAAGAPAGFPMPQVPASSPFPMDRMRAMGGFGGQPFGQRVNFDQPALPAWQSAGQDPLAQIKQILSAGKGPMKGQPPAVAAPAAGAVPSTIEQAIKLYYGNAAGGAANAGNAGDFAGHPDRFTPDRTQGSYGGGTDTQHAYGGSGFGGGGLY